MMMYNGAALDRAINQRGLAVRRLHYRAGLVRALGIAAVALLTTPTWGQQPRPTSTVSPARAQEPLSRSDRVAVVTGAVVKAVLRDETKKLVIEEIYTQTQANSAPVPAAEGREADKGKRKLEFPVKAAVQGSAPNPLAPASPAKDENPIVKPGEVKWHASFAEARGAGKKSGKPILLFHMMGQLDRQFC